MGENTIAKDVVDAAVKVHRTVGSGMLESAYEMILAHELATRGHEVVRQIPIPVRYEGVEFGNGFRADLLVDGLVFLELKSVDQVLPAHKKQLLTYLRFGGKRLDLLLNFGAFRMKDGVFRVVNGLPD
ncbi:MAG: GxxExxY protein [Deltaproteobacteria bacterium]|nr:GxxExxY protein [Deltaproteobacteria bacterium]